MQHLPFRFSQCNGVVSATVCSRRLDCRPAGGSAGLTLFGYDGPGGVVRFRLWPLPGWGIFAMKDAGVLAVATVLLLPLDLTAGLSSLLASLAIGHYGSIVRAPFQRRWRFSAGRLFMTGLRQIAAVFSIGTASQHFGLPVLGGAAAACAISAWWQGRVWDRSVRQF